MTKFEALLAYTRELAPKINALPQRDQLPAFEKAMRDWEAGWRRDNEEAGDDRG